MGTEPMTRKRKENVMADSYKIVDSCSGEEYRRYRIHLARDCKDMFCKSDFQACQYALAYAGCPQPVALQRLTIDGSGLLYTIFDVGDDD